MVGESVRGHFAVMWGVTYVGVILGSFWNRFGIVLESFWDNFGTVWESLWDHFEINLGSDWDNLGIRFGHFYSEGEGVPPPSITPIATRRALHTNSVVSPTHPPTHPHQPLTSIGRC